MILELKDSPNKDFANRLLILNIAAIGSIPVLFGSPKELRSGVTSPYYALLSLLCEGFFKTFAIITLQAWILF